MSQSGAPDHAFKGTRFPWTKERMEFILNELITKHKKYKAYTKLVEVYIILAEKIGATPRIVENFIKNLARDYREWMKMHPNSDRDKIKLRGSNKIFKLFEEYSRIYLREDPTCYPQAKLNEYLDEQDMVVQIPDGDDDGSNYLEVIDAELKEEPAEQSGDDSLQIMSVMSMTSQNAVNTVDDVPASPSPPPPPLPRAPKSQGRRSLGMYLPTSTTASPVLNDVASTSMAQSSQALQLKHATPRSSGPPSVQPTIPTNIYASATNPGVPPTISSLASLQQHPQFHLPQMAAASSSGVGAHYIPLHMMQNGSGPTTRFVPQAPDAAEETPSSIPGASNKRPMKAQHDTHPQPTKKSRAGTVPLVSENLPEGMTEFERRYLQSMDTQNKMLSDIGRELKLLRTGFFAIHSDQIADMVNPNMH